MGTDESVFISFVYAMYKTLMRTVFLLCLHQYSILKTILVNEGEIRAYTVADGTVYQCCRQHAQCNGCFVARELNC